MSMSLTEWDEKIAPWLKELESRAAFIKTKAACLEIELTHLKSRPEFLTKFQTELADAMYKLQSVYNAYMNKPIE